jgi:hypothetical protein
MGDVDAYTLAESARRYNALRRRYWRFFLSLLALCFPAAAIGLAVEQRLYPVIRGVLFVALFLAALTCWVGAIVTNIALQRFRCPRCGKPFICTLWCCWPSDRCKHCDLDLGPATLAVAKEPPAEVDF